MTDPKTTALPLRIKWLLGVSLALNLAVVGAITGAVLRHDGPGGRFVRAPGADSYAAPYVMALPRADRRAIFAQVRKDQQQADTGRTDRRARYAQVIDALRATPFDRAALQAALDAQKATSLKVQSSVQAAWLDRVALMSDEARAAYASGIEEVLRNGPRPGRAQP